jgi:hypothetical protein
VNQSSYSPLKWLGLVLIFGGIGVLPLTLFAFATLHPILSPHVYHVILAGVLVLGDGSLLAGVVIMMLESRSAQRRLY